MIHLIYRHTDYIHNCGRGKNRPYYFSYDNCLNNILSTIENIDFIKFHLVHDGVNNSTDPRIHFIQNIEGKSEYKSWGEALKYAKTLDLKDDDLIYFIENDYLHVKGWPYKWGIRPTTTGTFMVSKKTFDQDYDLWLNDPRGDHYKFTELANQKGRSVIFPISSLSTHCEVEWLAPVIDWENISKNY